MTAVDVLVAPKYSVLPFMNLMPMHVFCELGTAWTGKRKLFLRILQELATSWCNGNVGP